MNRVDPTKLFFLCFFFFGVKLGHFAINNFFLYVTKMQAYQQKTEKFFVSEEKKFGRIDSRFWWRKLSKDFRQSNRKNLSPSALIPGFSSWDASWIDWLCRWISLSRLIPLRQVCVVEAVRSSLLDRVRHGVEGVQAIGVPHWRRWWGWGWRWSWKIIGKKTNYRKSRFFWELRILSDI